MNMNKAEFYYTEVCRRTEEQNQARKQFDNTAIAVLGFAGILLSLTPFAASKWSDYSIYPAIILGVAFIALAVSTIYGLWLRNWQFQPNLPKLFKHIKSKKHKDEDLILWSANCMSDAIANNKKPLKIKAICLLIAYIFLSIEALSLIAIFSLGVYLSS
jgi:hypothetical protein